MSMSGAMIGMIAVTIVVRPNKIHEAQKKEKKGYTAVVAGSLGQETPEYSVDTKTHPITVIVTPDSGWQEASGNPAIPFSNSLPRSNLTKDHKPDMLQPADWARLNVHPEASGMPREAEAAGLAPRDMGVLQQPLPVQVLVPS